MDNIGIMICVLVEMGIIKKERYKEIIKRYNKALKFRDEIDMKIESNNYNSTMGDL